MNESQYHIVPCPKTINNVKIIPQICLITSFILGRQMTRQCDIACSTQERFIYADIE